MHNLEKLQHPTSSNAMNYLMLKLAKKLGITKELAQQVISNRQANAAATLNKPLTQDELFEKVLESRPKLCSSYK